MSLIPLFLALSQGPAAAPKHESLADIQRQVALVEGRIKAGEKWTVKQGRYVSFHYVPAPSTTDPLVSAQIGQCDKAVEEDCKILGIDLPSDPIDVYFYPNATDFGKALDVARPITGGMSLGNWSAFPDPQSMKELHATACHELGHALAHEAWGLYGCQVFTEGLGYYLQARANDEAWLKDPKPNEEEPFKDLVVSAKFAPDYRQGASFVAYLLVKDNGNPARLQALYTGLSKARVRELQGVGNESWPDRVEKVFLDTYGEDLDHLEADWRGKG